MMTNSNSEMTEKEATIALLPFYLSGTLSKEETKQVDAWLQSDTQAGAILDKIDQERHSSVIANESIIAPKTGLARLMADVAQTPQENTATSRVLSSTKGGVMAWIDQTILAPLQAAPAQLAWGVCGLLMLVTIGQSTLLYQGKNPTNGAPGFELAGGEHANVLSSAIIKFTPSASMAAITKTLDEVGAIIMNGPTASGQFTIGFVARENAPALAERLTQLQKRTDLISFFALQKTDDGLE